MDKVNRARKLLGQCFFIGFDGLEIPDSIAKFIKTNSIAGVSLFANNYESPAQVAELNNSIQALRTDELPLGIAVDHEGGKVQRFKDPFIVFPEAHEIGIKDSPKLAFECAQVMAEELKAVGCNIIYAPVADINTNPKNPVIGKRAFGDTEEHVSKMVTAYVRGFITHGVQPVVKHFPGHGDTTQDSHFHLPKINTPLETLMERETRPFVKAFKSRCNLVMTAHIIVESVDQKLPATLSEKVLQGILRDQIRYRGLIVSDDMEMKAISDNFGEVEAAIMAIEAGCDILLYHTEPFQIRAFDGILSKLTSPEGAKALKRLEESAKRVEEFKKKNFLPYTPVSVPEISKIIGKKDHQDILKKALA